MPRNTVCSAARAGTVLYEQTSSHAEISGPVIKEYPEEIHSEGLPGQTASPRRCFTYHLQEEKHLAQPH